MANILIIDDDPDMVLATRLCLESAGHKVDSAGDPAEGQHQHEDKQQAGQQLTHGMLLLERMTHD